jgi:hypothetical protein
MRMEPFYFRLFQVGKYGLQTVSCCAIGPLSLCPSAGGRLLGGSGQTLVPTISSLSMDYSSSIFLVRVFYVNKSFRVGGLLITEPNLRTKFECKVIWSCQSPYLESCPVCDQHVITNVIFSSQHTWDCVPSLFVTLSGSRTQVHA